MTFHRDTVAAEGQFLWERIEAEHTATSRETSDRGGLTDLYGVPDLKPYLAFDEWPTDEPYPDWVTALSKACQSLDNGETGRPSSDRPFAEIVEGFLPWATGDVLSKTVAPVTEAALGNLRENLRKRLSDLLAQPLHLDYLQFARAGDDETKLSSESTRQREEYAAEFSTGRCGSFFEEFPLLGRLLVETVHQWRGAVDRLLERLTTDRDAVVCLVSSDNPFPVDGFDLGAGDAHGGGETVVEVSLAHGRVVYKPRSVGPEQSLSDFFSRLSELTDLSIPALPSVVERSGYGWMGFVSPDPFEAVEAVADYYRRGGVVAWLATILGATDLHSENLVATENGPVVVDAETAVSLPRSDTTASTGDVAVRTKVATDSVLGRALVPFHTPEDRSDRSGYGAISEEQLNRLTPEWSNLETDAIEMQYEPGTFVPRGNHPRLDGDPAPPWLFTDELIEGFQRAQTAVAERVETVQAAAVEAFRETELRVLPRQSMLYQSLLDTLSNPQYLRDAATHELKLVRELNDRWSDCQLKKRNVSRSRVVAAERDALLRRDIPRFTVPVDGRSLWLDDERIATGVYQKSPLESLSDRVRRTATENLARQRKLLHATVSGERLPRPSGTGDNEVTRDHE